MRDYHWQELSAAETSRLVTEMNPFIKPQPLDPNKVEIQATPLPFYDDYKFYAVVSEADDQNKAVRFALYKPGDVHFLNWTNDPIYRVNEKAPIKLDPKNVAHYACFFFDHVKGRHGRFIIIERAEDMPWTEEATDFDREKLSDQMQKLTYKGIGRDSRFTLEARVLFKNALFKTMIRVAPDGLIELTDEELLLEELPILQDPVAG